MKPPPLASALVLGGVILAAGRSTRMGRPKLLLPWGESTILGHLLAQWRSLGTRQCAVVCAADDEAIARELERLGVPGDERIYNPDPERGMFSSLQAASRWQGWNASLTHWAVVLGDQPHLRHHTLRRLLEFSAAHPGEVCQPARAGHGRHPVILPRSAFLDLADSAAADLKEFLAAMPRPPALCEMQDPELDLDMDRPEDYVNILRAQKHQ